MLLALAVVFVVLAMVVGFAATRPDQFRIERSIAIAAPPAQVYALLEDFKRWIKWSPWEALDPALARNYAGAPAGLGAIYEWRGNNKAGQGRMEIIESTPAQRLVIKLDFLKPFEAHNLAEFTLTPAADGCRLVWAMHGPSPLPARIIGLVFDMDRMVGKDFERGLANLKAACEP